MEHAHTAELGPFTTAVRPATVGQKPTSAGEAQFAPRQTFAASTQQVPTRLVLQARSACTPTGPAGTIGIQDSKDSVVPTIRVSAMASVFDHRRSDEGEFVEDRGVLRRRHGLILAAFLVLSGCTTVGRGVATEMPNIPPGKGIVIFSTSSAETSLSFPWKMTLVDGASKKRFDKVIIFIDAKTAAPTFSARNTIVRSLTLNAGTYYLVPLPGNPAMRVVNTPIYTFSVEEGRIQYAGNVMLGNQGLSIATDGRERDVNFFMVKNPSLKSMPVVTRSMTVDSYIAPGNRNQFAIEGVIWEAPQ